MPKVKNKKPKPTVQHIVPDAFWSQVFSVVMLIFALIILMGIFGIKGWLTDTVIDNLQNLIGASTYISPLVLIWLAIKRFFSKEGKLPISVVINVLIFVMMFSAATSILTSGGGGSVGDLISEFAVSMLGSIGSLLVFILIGAVNLMFIFSKTPKDVYGYFKSSMAKSASAREEHGKTIKLNEDEPEKAAKTKFKLGSILNKKEKKAHVDGIQQKTELKVKSHQEELKKHGTKLNSANKSDRALTIDRDDNWMLPESELLESKNFKPDAGDIKKNAQIIKDTLADFKVDVEMEEANIGPRVTQFTLKPPSGVRLQKITALDTNLSLNLAAESIRIEAPIPGKKAVGIEVPNKKSAIVTLRSILESKVWADSGSGLSFAIGKDISGITMVGELDAMPHLLIAGQTGSGKSIMINAFLISLLYRNSPSDLKLILVDPKRVELSPYNHIPHLLTQVITDPEKCLSALKWAVDEMERRYELLAENGKREIKSYNNRANLEDKLPYVVIVIDELADLMMVAAREVESLIVRIAQKARAVGIHLVLATQRPSVDVITGLIKANIPARVAFTVASQVDSRTIIDQTGAEKLLGKGDLLYTTPQISKPKRIQGAFVGEDEINNVINFIKSQAEPNYDENVVKQHVNISSGGIVMDIDSSSGDEDMLKDAMKVVVESGKASASLLQRRLRIGYSRASRLIDVMEERGVVGPADGARPREVLISSLDEG